MKVQKLVQLPVLTGEDAPGAKLSRSEAQEIKSALANGGSAKDLSVSYGVGYQTVYLIGLGETWKELSPKGRVLSTRVSITPELRDRIFWWKKRKGATNAVAAERFGVSTSAVSRAVKDGRAIFALRVHRAVLSSSTYEQVSKEFKIPRSEIEELMTFVAAGGIPTKLKLEID